MHLARREEGGGLPRHVGRSLPAHKAGPQRFERRGEISLEAVHLAEALPGPAGAHRVGNRVGDGRAVSVRRRRLPVVAELLVYQARREVDGGQPRLVAPLLVQAPRPPVPLEGLLVLAQHVLRVAEAVEHAGGGHAIAFRLESAQRALVPRDRGVVTAFQVLDGRDVQVGGRQLARCPHSLHQGACLPERRPRVGVPARELVLEAKLGEAARHHPLVTRGAGQPQAQLGRPERLAGLTAGPQHHRLGSEPGQRLVRDQLGLRGEQSIELVGRNRQPADGERPSGGRLVPQAPRTVVGEEGQISHPPFAATGGAPAVGDEEVDHRPGTAAARVDCHVREPNPLERRVPQVELDLEDVPGVSGGAVRMPDAFHGGQVLPGVGPVVVLHEGLELPPRVAGRHRGGELACGDAGEGHEEKEKDCWHMDIPDPCSFPFQVLDAIGPILAGGGV